jgi:hypothetical protein
VIPASSLVEYAQQALVLATLVSLPVIGVAAVVGRRKMQRMQWSELM